MVNLLVQPVITKWEGFAEAKLYSLGEDTAFADFDPGTAECLEGTSMFFDEDTLQRMMDEVNRALKFGWNVQSHRCFLAIMTINLTYIFKSQPTADIIWQQRSAWERPVHRRFLKIAAKGLRDDEPGSFKRTSEN
ncbi:hypothetical protein [Paenibacillus sp. DMB5]|uniref:hypothetical protein n=1 Tax=Paenibacillus sp. DMB5 TaxID=1780103 RepID=UPI000FE14AF3|nr:hypothetical protein [Paenibacillus sp. DMB5]